LTLWREKMESITIMVGIIIFSILLSVMIIYPKRFSDGLTFWKIFIKVHFPSVDKIIFHGLDPYPSAELWIYRCFLFLCIYGLILVFIRRIP
jgi:hypothetical protein